MKMKYLFKLDYVLPLSKMKIETGYQARLDRDFEWNDVYRYSIIDDYKPSKASADYTILISLAIFIRYMLLEQFHKRWDIN